MIKKFGLCLVSAFGVAQAGAQTTSEPQGPILIQTNSGASIDVGSFPGASNTLQLRSSENLNLSTPGSFVEADLAQEARSPLKFGNDFSSNNFAQPADAARFRALDLSTPMPLRTMRGDSWSTEMTFSASGARTGLGFDVQATPRAAIQRNTAGGNVARLGGEIRLGQGLAARDLRGTGAAAPSWYFFIGADNEALVWNVGDRAALNGVTLQDAVTTGDVQVGVAWKSAFGGQMSLGVIERELKFNDIAGDNDVKRKDHFAAFSYTLRR